MSYALTTQGQGDAYFSLTNWNFNQVAGTAGVAKINIDFSIENFRGSAFAILLGASNSTISYLRVNSDGSLELRSSGTRIISAAGAIQLGQRYTVRLEYLKSTTTTTMYIDDIQVSGEWVATNNLGFNQINRISTTTTNRVDITVYALFMDGDAIYDTYADRWDDTTATGSGTTWTSTGGTRSITIVNATGATDSWWQFYNEENNTNESSIDSSYAKYTSNVTGSNIKPVVSLSSDATYSKYTGSINTNAFVSGLNASLNATYPKYTSIIGAGNNKPILTSNIEGSYLKHTANIIGSNTKPVVTANINSSYGKYTGSVNAGAATTNNLSSIIGNYPKYTGTLTANRINAVFITTINNSYPKYSTTINASRVIPTYSSNINGNYPKYTSNVSLQAVYLDRTLSISGSYPKYTGSIFGGLLSANRSCMITASYPKYFAVVIEGEINLVTKAGVGRNLDISFGSRNYQHNAGAREINIEV